jgi:hypothetical protein
LIENQVTEAQLTKSDRKTKPDDGKWVAPINNTLYSLFETVNNGNGTAYEACGLYPTVCPKRRC